MFWENVRLTVVMMVYFSTRDSSERRTHVFAFFLVMNFMDYGSIICPFRVYSVASSTVALPVGPPQSRYDI